MSEVSPAAAAAAIRIVLADDEPLARRTLRRHIEAEPGFTVLAECADGKQAVEAIRAQRPDVVFLDIRMPGLDGFQVLQALEPAELPAAVVFVTAFDEYALRAFEFHSLDYLLKPFDKERFAKTAGRLRESLARRAPAVDAGVLAALLADLQKRTPPRLAIKTDANKIIFVRPDEIDWVEAAANYVVLHCGKQTHLLRQTMSKMEEALDPGAFVRIHRSAIVNIDRIRELHPSFHGDYSVILNNGHELTLSRYYRDRAFEKLGRF